MLVELHPLVTMVETLDPLVVDFPYGFDGPHVYSGTGTYANRDADIEWTTVQYAHSVGEVVTAAASAGLALQHLEEHISGSFNTGQFDGPEDDGRYRLRLGVGAARDGVTSPACPMPVLYTLIARSSARPGRRATMTPAVRRLGGEDWAVLRAVRLLALDDAPYAFMGTLDDERAQPEAAWRERVVEQAWFVAVHREKPAGVAAGGQLREPEPDVRTLRSMWVAPGLRGTGSPTASSVRSPTGRAATAPVSSPCGRSTPRRAPRRSTRAPGSMSCGPTTSPPRTPR